MSGESSSHRRSRRGSRRSSSRTLTPSPSTHEEEAQNQEVQQPNPPSRNYPQNWLALSQIPNFEDTDLIQAPVPDPRFSYQPPSYNFTQEEMTQLDQFAPIFPFVPQQPPQQHPHMSQQPPQQHPHMSQQPPQSPQQPPRSPQQPPRSPVYEDAYEAYREGIRRFERESQSPPQQQPQQNPEEHPEEDPEEDPEEHPEEIPQPRQQRRRRKPRSEMWKYFTEINDDEGKKGRCNKCEKIINADSRHQGTSALHHHYRMCVLPGSSSSHTQVSRHDPQEYRKELVKYIVSTDQAFSHVESKGFGRFVHYLAPDIIEISRKALRSDIMKFFEQDKEELKALFMLRRFNVALTSDIWTGNAKMDYMSVVAHNIDEEWNLNKRIIAFKRIEGSHTADNILDILLSVIDEWNLRDRIISITLDNAANNNRMVRALRTRIPNQASILHQRCATHIINLIVKAAFTHFDVAITKIREAISWINSSNSRVDSLKRHFFYLTALRREPST